MDKLFISADIEGVCGIVDWKETNINESQSAYFRDEMTREVAAACEAASDAGVKEIFIKDAHGSGRNINPAKLPRNIRIMRAFSNDPYSMMSGIDASFGGVVFIGYHSAAGTNGNPLAHTMNGDNVHLLINGEPASEFLINSYTAAMFGVPVLALSGDRLLCESCARFDPAIQTAAVSEGLGGASISVHPDVAADLIREAVSRAMAAPPRKPALPARFDTSIRFRHHPKAFAGSFYPGARQTGAYELSFSSDDWMEVLRFLFFAM